jgi:hypothetical protein
VQSAIPVRCSVAQRRRGSLPGRATCRPTKTAAANRFKVTPQKPRRGGPQSRRTCTRRERSFPSARGVGQLLALRIPVMPTERGCEKAIDGVAFPRGPFRPSPMAPLCPHEQGGETGEQAHTDRPEKGVRQPYESRGAKDQHGSECEEQEPRKGLSRHGEAPAATEPLAYHSEKTPPLCTALSPVHRAALK